MPTNSIFADDNTVMQLIQRRQMAPPAAKAPRFQTTPGSLFDYLPMSLPENPSIVAGPIGPMFPGAELAWPKALTDAIGLGKNVLQEAQTGEFSPESTLGIGLGLAGGPGAMGATRPANSFGSFGGRRALTAPTEKMREASRELNTRLLDPYTADPLMAKLSTELGHDKMIREDIYQKTGVHFGPDEFGRLNVPRFEIDESPGFNPDFIKEQPNPFNSKRTFFAFEDPTEIGLGGGLKVSDVYDNPPLMQAYPELKDYGIQAVDPLHFGISGGFNPETKVFSLGRMGSLAGLGGVMSHEMQHAIQSIEDWPLGANPIEFEDPAIWQRLQAVKPKFDFANEEAKRFFAQRLGQEPADFEIENLFREAAEVNPSYSPKYGQKLHEKAKDNLVFIQQGLGPNLWRDLVAGIEAKFAYDKDHGNAYKKYKNTYGEAEARNSQNRLLARYIKESGSAPSRAGLDDQFFHEVGGAIASPYSKSYWANMFEQGLGGKMKSPYSTFDVPQEDMWARFFYPLTGGQP